MYFLVPKRYMFELFWTWSFEIQDSILEQSGLLLISPPLFKNKEKNKVNVHALETESKTSRTESSTSNFQGLNS